MAMPHTSKGQFRQDQEIKVIWVGPVEDSVRSVKVVVHIANLGCELKTRNPHCCRLSIKSSIARGARRTRLQGRDSLWMHTQVDYQRLQPEKSLEPRSSEGDGRSQRRVTARLLKYLSGVKSVMCRESLTARH